MFKHIFLAYFEQNKNRENFQNFHQIVFTLGEKTVNRSKKEQGVHGQTKQWRSHITPLNGIIEVQILEFSSMGLCGCHLKEKLEVSNGTYKGTIWRQIRISRSDDRQKQAKDSSNRWNEYQRKYSLFKKNLAACIVNGTHTIKTWTVLMKWNTYKEDEYEKPFAIVIINCSKATWHLLLMSYYCSL